MGGPEEAAASFYAECLLSASVMLGVAAEAEFLRVLDVATSSAQWGSIFAPVRKAPFIRGKIHKFQAVLAPHRKNLPHDVMEDLDTNLSMIQSVLRVARNDAGHPPITRPWPPRHFHSTAERNGQHAKCTVKGYSLHRILHPPRSVIMTNWNARQHSYEELRMFIIDELLAGTCRSFDELQERVSQAILKRNGQWPPRETGLTYPAAVAELHPNDSSTILEVFWDLFRQGVGAQFGTLNLCEGEAMRA